MNPCLLLRYSVWNNIHEERIKISHGCVWWSRSPSSRQIGLRLEPVTNLGIGYKVFGRCGVIAELLSQLPDKSTKIFQLAAVLRSPDRSQNTRVRKRKSGVRHQ